MSFEIGLIFFILVIAILLFVTEWIRMDLVALLVLVSLAVTGLVTPTEALSGFSNGSVVTVWAVFILGGGLAKSGVSRLIGQQVLRIAGDRERGVIGVVMLVTALMSAFMNNVGVAALMLPIVIDIGRQTKIASSRLLMPMAYSALLGGALTLIGTPPNILLNDVLLSAGLEPFQFFSFTPIGGVLLLAGILFMLFIGRFMLGEKDPVGKIREGVQGDVALDQMYQLGGQLSLITIPKDSPLVGQSLMELSWGTKLGITVIGVFTLGGKYKAAQASTVLRAGDQMLVIGRFPIEGAPDLSLVANEVTADAMHSREILLMEAVVEKGSLFAGKSLIETKFRDRSGANIVLVERGGAVIEQFTQRPLAEGDRLLMQVERSQVEKVRQLDGIKVAALETGRMALLNSRFLMLDVAESSPLVGQTVEASGIGLSVAGIVRGENGIILPKRETLFMAGDRLLVEGNHELFRGMDRGVFRVEDNDALERALLQHPDVALVEAVLAPRTSLTGKSLRQIDFRMKYQLTVLAIWRNEKAYYEGVRDMILQPGDALLLYGGRENFTILAKDQDFILLAQGFQEEVRQEKALVATLIMVGVIGTVLISSFPLSIVAIAASVLMVLTGCLKMEEMYGLIEWKAVFLIAGMLPLGIAMEKSGAASLLAEQVIYLVGGFGPTATAAGLFLLTVMSTQMMPNSAVALLMGPIALETAFGLQISPHALVMVVAVASSASFLSPVAHPANLLIMGPGGYRFTDYLRVGGVMSLLVMVVLLLILPFVFPY